MNKILIVIVSSIFSLILGFKLGYTYKSGQIAKQTVSSLNKKIETHNANNDVYRLAKKKESEIVKIVYKEQERIRDVVKIVPCDKNKISQEAVDNYNKVIKND